jgi:hypothetical protein
MRHNLRIRDPEQVVQKTPPELILSDDCRMESPSVDALGDVEIGPYAWPGDVKAGAPTGKRRPCSLA